MANGFSVVPSAYVLLRRADEVLLQLRRGTGYRDGFWACGAAGHVERAESVLDAARREAAEELGITVAPEDLRPLTVMHRTGGDGRPVNERVDFFFECRRWSGQPRLVEPDKAAELRWAGLGALPDPVVPHELDVLRLLGTGAVAPLLTHGF
ncbi:NUDIX hydrolase [Saccharopolyspora cebuensis]|uniref:NUDIX domain-containing protein n=1 Tax=Saccharopolyspora cebuensis TaxID=418759 RepID=A0ABV4CPL9_9PSEU